MNGLLAVLTFLRLVRSYFHPSPQVPSRFNFGIACKGTLRFVIPYISN